MKLCHLLYQILHQWRPIHPVRTQQRTEWLPCQQLTDQMNSRLGNGRRLPTRIEMPRRAGKNTNASLKKFNVLFSY